MSSKLSVKYQAVNVLDFEGHKVTVASTQLCLCPMKAVIADTQISMDMFQ